MTAVDRVPARTFGASRRSRRLSIVVCAYIVGVGIVTFARAGSMDNVIRVGESAAALAMVVATFCVTISLVVVFVRAAALTVDDAGVSWGYGLVAFRLRAAAIQTCRVYRDAVAVVRRGGRFTWYVCARDYTPFADVLAAFRRSHLPLSEDGGRAPLAARLQSYGLAIDLILVADALLVSFVFLAS